MATVLAQNALASWLTFETARDRGAVFTPDYVAQWVASLVRENCNILEPVIADFGCGSGNLLAAAAQEFPSGTLVGVEIDRASAALAQERLGSRAKVIVDDFLVPASLLGAPPSTHWIERIGAQPDVLIMNPPWGASHNLTKQYVGSSGLTLAQGQFDTYDLFCELALQIVRPGGVFAFIIPDSIFLPEHEDLRRLLVARTSLILIARLGEGIFQGVYRGCAVVIGRCIQATIGHRTECVRLTKVHRDGLREGNSLADCRREAAHWVPQARFEKNSGCRFDIDVSVNDETVDRVVNCCGNWTSELKSRRGTELSKFGRIVLCDECGAARPQPKLESAECLQCGALLRNKPHVIVADAPSGEGLWKPFIVGEDVRRYSAEPRRWIRADLRGINYKEPHSAGVPRILVRKTGIGLNAALDASNALTNQVVFEYTLRGHTKFDFSYLHYVLGVLCSRILLAVHLKRGGELEWRSHPYVTQKTLAELPIPLPKPNTREWHQAAAIAGAVKRQLNGEDSDLEIEALVAGLYGLSAEDMTWVAQVLSSAGNLEAIRNLRLPVDQVIQPITVH